MCSDKQKFDEPEETATVCHGPAGLKLEDIGVVVLNYNDYQATISCVKSILNCDPTPSAIIVVDNRSPNQSMRMLDETFKENELVTVIDSGRNGGYSFGNNVGIRELRRRGIRHVVIATSDTRVVSENLFAQFLEVFDESVGVVGPQIRGSRSYQNPPVAKLNLKYIFDLWWVQRGMPGLEIRRRLRQVIRCAIGVVKNTPRTESVRTVGATMAPREVYMLHGAFLCLTASYLDRYESLDERIFLFGEEDLLAWQCFRANLRQQLLEYVLVEHDDDSSIKMTWGDKASEFVDNEQRRSGRVLRVEIRPLKLALEWLRLKKAGR